MSRLDSAHEHWDKSWKTPAERWTVAEPEVVDLFPSLQESGARRILDVGAGVGRHSLALAHAGFKVFAVDASPAGLQAIKATAVEQAVTINITAGTFVDMPVGNDCVDHILAWNVIYHGDGDVAANALTECRRVLRPGGSVQFTMLTKRNAAFGIGEEVAPDTFVDSASEDDKAHPHFYVDFNGLANLLTEHGLTPRSIIERDQSPPGAFHWHVVAAL